MITSDCSDYSSGATERSYNVLSFYKETRLRRCQKGRQILQKCVQKVYSFQKMKKYTENVQFPKGEKVYRKCTVSALMDTLSVHLNGVGKVEKVGSPSEYPLRLRS